jgi:hypothetical protein
MTVILGVDLAAALAVLASSSPITRSDIGIATLLASLSITYSRFTVSWERARRALAQEKLPTLCPNLLATWAFAAAVMLPISLAAAVIVLASIAEWPARNIAGQATPYRYVYSTASAILAASVAGSIVSLNLAEHVGLAIAAVGYVVVGMAAVALAMISVGQYPVLKVWLQPHTYRLEILTITIALAEVQLTDWHLPLVWLSLPAAIAIQRRTVKSELRISDELSIRPMTEAAWLTVAREVITACPVTAIMRIDTTDPVAVSMVARLQAGCDAIGTAGSGLAILLADCPGTNADSLAVRMRSALHQQGIIAPVAVAAKPRDGQSLADLLAVSEAELITRAVATGSAGLLRPEA